MRRLLAIATVIGTIALMGPAHGQDATSASVSGVPEVSRGTISIHAQASSPSGISKIEIVVSGIVVARTEPSGVRQDASLDHSWNTAQRPGSTAASANGSYTVKVNAYGNDGTQASATAGTLVDNNPTAPGGLVWQAREGQVTLNWSTNPEPDITGYRVERGTDGSFSHVATVQATSFSESMQPGKYQYRVLAVRSSSVSSGGNVSEPSGAVEATVAQPDGTNPSSETEADPSEQEWEWAKPGAGRSRSGRGGVAGFGAFGGGGGLKVGGRSIAFSGLPSAASLPGLAGLPNFPAAQEGLAWGSYEEQLPYDLPDGAAPIVIEDITYAGERVWEVIPPDGLRWVAAGILLLSTATCLRVLAVRLDPASQPPARPKRTRGRKRVLGRRPRTSFGGLH